MKEEKLKITQVAINAANPRTITEDKFNKLISSILVLPKMLEVRPVVVDSKFVALGGNMRIKALQSIAEMSADDIASRLAADKTYSTKNKAEQDALLAYWAEWLAEPYINTVVVDNFSEAEQKEFIIKDNVSFGKWDWDMLANEWDTSELEDWGMEVWQNEEWKNGEPSDATNSKPANTSLNDRFVVPLFSILDTRKGYWQQRKKMWREQIGDMGESRNDKLITSLEIKFKDLYQRTRKHREELGISFKEYIDKYISAEVLEHEASKVLSKGVSLFDPVLSETMCKWFTPYEGAKIFDCFAGDTYKGLVFAMCGFSFRGIELRQEQVDINNRVLEGRGLDVEYICDDGRNVAQHIAPESQDLLFSCPPYFDLEKYSDLENDASNQDSYEDFIKILENAFKAAVGCLKDNRFAVIVVGDVRDKSTGFYYDFCGDIKRIFKEAGMPLYNEIILVETGASTALRAGRYMESRKVGKMHQNVLVFYKGNTKEIKNNFKKIEYKSGDLEQFEVYAEDETA